MMANKLKLNFISDAGHGWIETPLSLVRELNIAPKISTYSYQNGFMAYLEEDCDAAILIGALSQANIEFELKSIYHEGESRIRNYNRFVA